MLSSAIVIADGLGDGFARAARAADLPDVIVRFDPEARGRVASRIRALPDIAAFSTREEFTNVDIGANGHSSGQGSAEVIGAGRRGYAIVAGRDLSSRYGEVVVERGLAQAWGIPLDGTLYVRGLGPQRVVGFAEAPDNVGFPLAVPRFYLSGRRSTLRFGPDPNPQVNVAEIWLRDPRYLNEVLVQARTTSYGLRGLRVITRSGVRVLLDQAAGIVIDLLVALSLFALATAGVMLAASARAEVQRRLKTIGISRAVGASRGHVVRVQAVEAATVAIPAATVGVLAGVLATRGTERPPADDAERASRRFRADPATRRRLGAQRLDPRARGRLARVARRRTPAGRAAPGRGARGRSWIRRRRAFGAARAGLAALGTRLVAARRGRLAATVLTLGTSTAFVLLLLALASALSVLETDPGALGKRYQLTSSVPAAEARRGPLGARRAGCRSPLRGAGRRLVLARRDDRRDRIPGRSHDLRGASAHRRAQAEGRRRGGGRRRPRGRAGAESRIDARDRAAVRRRAAAARRRRRQLARPRRTRRVHPCGRVVAG